MKVTVGRGKADASVMETIPKWLVTGIAGATAAPPDV